MKIYSIWLLLIVAILTGAQNGPRITPGFEQKHLAELRNGPQHNVVINKQTEIKRKNPNRFINHILFSGNLTELKINLSNAIQNMVNKNECESVRENERNKYVRKKCTLKTIEGIAVGVVWSKWTSKGSDVLVDCNYARSCSIPIGLTEDNAIIHLDKVEMSTCTKKQRCPQENDVTPKPLCSSTRPKRAPFSGDTSCVVIRTVERSVCDFEKDFCDWSRAPGSTFNFAQVKGPTDVANKTGPTADRHGSPTGYYIYADASNNMGQIATLRSPNFSSGTYCMEFYYHMFGVNFEGSLQLMMYTSKTAPQSVFTKTSSIGNKWNRFQGILNATALKNETFHFEFKARIGKSYTSDIAVDDISITKGRCSK
ncbi:MAM and LDL-receptor class A domain-containing protein 1-like [Dreissena polymorpha]|uniref:MAM domain-containing protein n=1 Tax=Dreissena polymorpha TaxID=45954 RepID=A0A9D3YYW4_DREPO|nr:MAM and LDL-receptor class A domain-containing protein 1-like [Dreissena polymorpha]KAH3708817.1 hypothetical protein DPMN_068276 [Dreissena polymorpha]